MNISKIVYRLSLPQPRFEFTFILIWTLFFPSRNTYIYFLTFGILITLMLIHRICHVKNVGFSSFSIALLLFNLIFFISLFFSSYHLKSILFFTDVFLISLYFIFLYLDPGEVHRYLNRLVYCLSLFSLIHVLMYVLPFFGKKSLFLDSPIHQGIVSGLAVVLTFSRLIEKVNRTTLLLFLINIFGVYVSASKAAFLGIFIFCLYLVVLKKRRWLPYIVISVVLTFLVPNPVKHMFYYSITKDPYVLNRLDMWKMSMEIFRDHPVTGVGLDNFSTVSLKYNFKQERGPAHYFKAPRTPHSDYFKVLAETGIMGFLLLLAVLFFLIRKALSPPFHDVKKVLVLFLLFQALFINVLFHVFFFFLLIFFIKVLFEKNLSFSSISKASKWLLLSFLAAVFIFSYLFPYFSQRLIKQSFKSENSGGAVELLETATFLNPLNHEAFYVLARHHLKQFRERVDLNSFSFAIAKARRAQKLNPYDINGYLVEVDLYLAVLSMKLKYVSLEQEVLDPLERAERVAPQNPFIKLKKAGIYLEFGRTQMARIEALKALELEPDYAAALFFLHEHFEYIADEEEFQKRVEKIRKKRDQYQSKPGTYLYELLKIPENYDSPLVFSPHSDT